jgi:site-specific recombinase XerC
VKLPAPETSGLPAPAGSRFPVLLPPSREHVEAVLEHRLAPATWRAYQRAWAEFLAYCERADVPALPAAPGTVADYVTALAGTPRPGCARGPRGGLPSLSLIEQHVAAITTLHRWAGHPPPTALPIVTERVAAIRRLRAEAGDRAIPKAAARAPMVRRLVEAANTLDSPVRERDRAILLILATRGLRRAEVSGLDLIDVTRTPEGHFHLHIRRSKSDQGGAGRKVPLHRAGGPWCAATALAAWLAIRETETPPPRAPLFVGDRRGVLVTWDRWGGYGRLRPGGVGAVVKRAATLAGLDPAEVAALGAHSLRRGKITDDVRAGRDIKQVADEVGHRSITTTAGYVEEAKLDDPSAWADVASRLRDA